MPIHPIVLIGGLSRPQLAAVQGRLSETVEAHQSELKDANARLATIVAERESEAQRHAEVERTLRRDHARVLDEKVTQASAAAAAQCATQAAAEAAARQELETKHGADVKRLREEAKADVDRLQAEHHNTVASLRAAHEARVGELETAASRLQQEWANERENIAVTRDAREEVLRAQLEEAKQQLESRHHQAQGELGSAAEQLASQQQRVQQLQSAAEEAQSREAELNGLVRELRGRCTAREAELERSAKAIADLDVYSKRQEESLEAQALENQRLVKELRELRARAAAADESERALARQARSLSDLDEYSKKAEAKIEALSADVRLLEQQLAAARESAQRSEAQLRGLQVELGEARTANDRLDTELTEVREKSFSTQDGLRQQLTRVTTELGNARERLSVVEEASQALAHVDGHSTSGTARGGKALGEKPSRARGPVDGAIVRLVRPTHPSRLHTLTPLRSAQTKN